MSASPDSSQADSADSLPPLSTIAPQPFEVVREAPALAGSWPRLKAHLDLICVDHGIFRALYPNLHKIDEDMWRSAQPSPRLLRKAQAMGIKTVLNLRGPRDCGGYKLEVETCAALGLDLVNFQVKSRDVPSKEILLGAKALFESIRYPALLHCKSGADRAGLMSTLYLIMHRGLDVAEATEQLSLRYGHMRQGKTGMIDYFFDTYLEARAETGIAFWDWVETVYERRALRRSYRDSWWFSTLQDKILRRE